MPGRDFIPGTNRLDFAPGETQRTIPIPILNNGTVEYPLVRLFNVRLFAPAEAATPLTEWTAKLVDDERPAIVDVTYDPYRQPLLLLEHFSTNWGRHTVHRNEVIQFPLPGGKKLLTDSRRWETSFTHVNGTPRPGFAVLDANDEVDSSFAPNDTGEPVPRSRFITSKGWTAAGSTDWALLQDGGVLGPTDAGRLRRLLSTGAEDETFRPPFENGFVHAVESSTGELWAFRSNAVHRLAANGALLASHELPALATDGVDVVAVQRDGQLLVRQFSDQGRRVLNRLQLDGTIDPSFATNIMTAPSLGVLPDARLVISGDGFLRLLDADGFPIPGFPSIELSGVGACCYPSFRGLNGPRVYVGGYVMGMLGVEAILLDHFPRTALHITAEIRREPAAWVELATESNGRTNFPVVFRRLGPTGAPAAVRFTTRDLTARAGRDYVAQDGVIEFAPLESESRSVSIPILVPPDPDQQATNSPGFFELVVTSASGIEMLPAPLRLFIGRRFGGPPHLDQIKRLRDGRVLLGGEPISLGRTTGIEFSDDLKAWRELPGSASGNNECGVWLDASAANSGTRFYRSVAK